MNPVPTHDYGWVDRFLAGAIGKPGKRTFYLFIESAGVPVWFKCEKGQVAALGEQGFMHASNLGLAPDEDMIEEMGEFPSPTRPQDVKLRIRSMALGIESPERLTMLIEGVEEDETISFTISAQQLLLVSLLSLKAVHAGRKECPKCLLPEDPEGHYCPSSNGHRLPG